MRSSAMPVGRPLSTLLLLAMAGSWSAVQAFSTAPMLTTTTTVSRQHMGSYPTCRMVAQEDIERPPTFLDENDDGFDDDDDDDDEVPMSLGAPSPQAKLQSRWESLNPKLKQRLSEKGQAKAIANKKKQETKFDKRRRAWMFYQEKERENKRASRVYRPLKFDERTPLSAFTPGMKVSGVVISLAKYGAYIDIGTECDGLLHISQITRDYFVETIRQVFTPGDEVTVTIRSTNPEKRKLHLTMLDLEEEEKEEEDDDEEGDPIPLQDFEIDDELWGVLKRVTDFGAYVDVGAEVKGFLHFMDHPSWTPGASPKDFMSRGDRVRIWVMDVDLEQRRVKLTANRPTGLPGPRIEPRY